jgi:hypothetical protein
MKSIKNKLKDALREGNYIVKSDDLDTVGDKIEKSDKDAVIKVVDEEVQQTDEEYNIYAICTDSIAKTAGTTERSEWSDSANDRYEKCIKNLKGKKGYKLGESVNPKMSKKQLETTILEQKNKKVVKTVKVKDILK